MIFYVPIAIRIIKSSLALYSLWS